MTCLDTSDFDLRKEGHYEQFLDRTTPSTNPLFIDIDRDPVDTSTAKRCFFLVLTGDQSDIIYKRDVSDSELRRSFMNYSILKSNIEALENHKDTIVVLDRDLLQNYNSENYELDRSEYVIVLPNIRKEHVMKYLKLYDTSTSIDQLSDIMAMYDYANCENDFNTKSSIIKLASNLSESMFWKKRFGNNMNEWFDSQWFSNPTNCKIVAEAKKTDKNDCTKLFRDSEKITADFYELSKRSEFDAHMVRKWLESMGDEKAKLALLINIILSKELCHLVVNNDRCLDEFRENIYKIGPYMRYIFGYSILSLYLEEIKKGESASWDDRFVFDIETASKLPYFPFNVHDLHFSPYFPVLVSDEKLNQRNNLLPPTRIKNQFTGITNLSDFKRNFNIWTTKNQGMSAFDGFDWKGIALVGDAIQACSQDQPVLENCMNTEGSLAKVMFFAEYYSDSATELVCNDETINDYIDTALKVFSSVFGNYKKIFSEDIIKNVKLDTEKRLNIYIKNDYLDESKFKLSDIDTATFRNNLFITYVTWATLRNASILEKFEANEKDIDSALQLVASGDINIIVVEQLPKPSSVEGAYCYAKSHNSRGATCEPNDANILIEEEIKFIICESVIDSKDKSGLIRDIVIRSIGSESFMSFCYKQTLGSSRAYYNGETVFMLPSCVCTLLSGVSPDLRSFDKNPFDTVITNHTRGFGVCLNKNQKQQLEKYSEIVKVKYGKYTPSSNAYKVTKNGRYTDGKYVHVDEGMCIVDMSDIKQQFSAVTNHEDQIDVYKLRTIDENGDVVPVKTWIIEAVIDSI